MSTKLGRNDLCPCGSGKKVKLCCKARRPFGAVTDHGRSRLFEFLEAYVFGVLEADFAVVFEGVWDDLGGRIEDLDEHAQQVCLEVAFMRFALDESLDDGATALDAMLRELPGPEPGVRAYAERLRGQRLRPHEVIDVVPGVSLTLRDLVGGSVVTVRERTASRTVPRHAWIAARIVRPGVSGQPEMERGVFLLPPLVHRAIRAVIDELRASLTNENDFAAELAYELHRAWLRCYFAPPIPALANTDGDRMHVTRVHYEVLDLSATERALAAESSLERDASGWSWLDRARPDGAVVLGRLQLVGGALVVETNSRERAERAQAMLAALAGGALKHRATRHEDPEVTVREELARRARGEASDRDEASVDAIPRELQEALALDHLARHYHRWVDEPVPALGGETPRAAAAKPASRGAVVELLGELFHAYQSALLAGEPAYDPSWISAELGLDEPTLHLPPPLAHERLCTLVEGASDVVQQAAEAVRGLPDFDDALASPARPGLRDRLDVRRFLREHEPTSTPDAPAFRRRALEPYLELAVAHAAHRRKVFWVDPALSLMLAHTEVDMLGAELRAPFPTFALVFTDRRALSLGERLLSRRAACPLAGLLLRVITVYVTERVVDSMHRLDLTFAFDALGDDLAELVEHRLDFGDATPVRTLFAEPNPVLIDGHPFAPSTPLTELGRLVIHATLYASSAGVEPVLRTPTSRTLTPKRGSGPTLTSEQVYYLPGTIDIRQVHAIETLSRTGEGRAALQRSLVRGHWRRAAKNWSDPRPRWIAPYWKGPDMAAVIERAYRLRV